MKIIATSDWHLSTVKPICRTDEDWIKTQQEHLQQIALAASLYKADVIVAGDVFDTPIVNPAASNIVHKFVRELPSHISFVVGNHDVSYHSMSNYLSSSIAGVWYSNSKPVSKLAILHYGETVIDGDNDADILALHTFAVPDETHRTPNRNCVTAQELVERYPQYRTIIIGDNHQHWVRKIGNQLVVNCGTLIQRTAAEAKGQCGFCVIDTDALTVEYQDLTDLSKDCIDTSYLEDIKEREENKEAYSKLLAELQNGVENKYDFISTLSEYVETNRTVIGEGVYNTLQKVIECIKGEKQ